VADDEFSLEAFYDAYPRIEEAFQAALDESLAPRGPEVLYELVGDLRLRVGPSVVDVGCGEGRHTIELARRFDAVVVGVDPVERHLELGTQAVAAVARDDHDLATRVHFVHGTAEALPVPVGTVDLVWCNEVLVHVRLLERALSELGRVLRRDGRVVVHQTFDTERLAPGERLPGGFPETTDPQRFEAAVRAAGLRIDERIVLGSEWGERAEEAGAHGTRRLLHAARLLRAPDRYVARFGRPAYDIMLGDCLWHVYRMIGKLSGRVYLLSAR
jgi:SAM-dependent methyltransferase